MFRFEAFWAKDGDCKEIVRRAWENNREGNLLERWNFKINVCRANLTIWSKEKFKQRGRQIQEMMSQLGNLQGDWSENFQEIKALSKKVDQLWSQEEKYWQ